MSPASRAAASASSHRPLSMQAHCSADRAAPLPPHAGSPQPAEGFPQEPPRELGLVQEPGRRADLGDVGDGSAGYLVQVGDGFRPVPERFGLCRDLGRLPVGYEVAGPARRLERAAAHNRPLGT